MDSFFESPGKGKFIGAKKYSTSQKDVKRKLSCINKRISDLYHQRKYLYKNSAKVKRMIHNQVNQLIKCLRTREHSLWSNVDEAYLSHDTSISDELSRLQSVYAQCHSLFNHIEDIKKTSDVFNIIDAILSEVNFSEKPCAKPLEFISDFETMKSKASNYGCLEGDYIKKDDFVIIDQENDKLSSVNGKQFHFKEKVFDQNFSSSSMNATISNQKDCYKSADDDFQIIDLLDNMCCYDHDDDFTMAEDKNRNCTPVPEKKLTELISCRNISNKECNSECSDEIHETSKVSNTEEWKQILEMNKKIASWHEMTSKVTEDMQIYHKSVIVNDFKISDKSCDKNCEQNRFLFLKDADNWLCKSNSKFDKMGKGKKIENFSSENNCITPVELIQKSFKSYLTKDNIQNWLSMD